MALVIRANDTQNLISASTIGAIWDRHVVDSAQLIPLGGKGHWLDIGSGAGLPGVIIAILSGEPTTLLEPRRLRAEFLAEVKAALSLTNLHIVQGKPALLWSKFTNITARAVAPLSTLFSMAHHLSRPETVWLFPKGRSAQKELDEARASWQGAFRLEPSVTAADASILVATGVQPRGKR